MHYFMPAVFPRLYWGMCQTFKFFGILSWIFLVFFTAYFSVSWVQLCNFCQSRKIMISISLHTQWHLFLFVLIAFDDEHCWEPYMPHGNFSSSDISYQLGTIVTFACSPGFVMEQGSGTIECIDPGSPHWNDSEPVCKGFYLRLFVQMCRPRLRWLPQPSEIRKHKLGQFDRSGAKLWCGSCWYSEH